MVKTVQQEEHSHHSDRGDEGAIPDALWSNRWTSWTREYRNEYFASVVGWGPLSMAQACHLLQGLPPMPHGWDEPETCLAEYESLVGRFKTDIQRGALPRNPTADELAAWCDAMNAQLPPAVVEALQHQAQGNMASAQMPQSSTPVKLASWIPAGLIQPTNACAPKPKRGRPQTAKATYDRMEIEGKRLLMDQARVGIDLTLSEIADHIRKTGLAPGMKDSSIVSRLKAKLPIEKARQTAANAHLKRA